MRVLLFFLSYLQHQDIVSLLMLPMKMSVQRGLTVVFTHISLNDNDTIFMSLFSLFTIHIEPTCKAGDTDLIPGLGRSSGKGNGNPLQ